MVMDDTIHLLRETNAGAKMGVESLEELMREVDDLNLKKSMKKNLETTKDIMNRSEKLLREIGNEEKDINPIAKTMSFLKTNVKLAYEHNDKTIAELVTDGCDMGTKSLMGYLNEYSSASKEAKSLAKELLESEEHLRMDMRRYL